MTRDIQLDTGDLILEVLETARRDLIVFLRSYTNVLRPPDFRVSYYFGLVEGLPAAKAPRRAHPGGWADISHELKKGYKSEIIQHGPADYELSLENTAPHAAFVEAKAGFWVVSGVFTPGGKVERSITWAFNFLSRKLRVGKRGAASYGKPTVQTMTVDDGIRASQIPGGA
jgi:hypothetical protein